MSVIKLTINDTNLLNYAEAGKVTIEELKTVMRLTANAGRTFVRQEIGTAFKTRTGKLKAQARAIRTKITANDAKLSARVGPLPSLLNIFENGANIPRMSVAVPGKLGARAFHFTHQGGDGGFARGKFMAGGGHLAARPIMRPALVRMEEVATEGIVHVLERIAP